LPVGPEAEAALGLVDANLVAALAPALPELLAEFEARIALGEAARLGHLRGALEQALEIDPKQRRRHHPERRQRRVAPADRRLAGEDLEEVALASKTLELGARVGDRHEELAAAAVSLPEEVEVGARLQGRPRL